jgi:hypothetical protein
MGIQGAGVSPLICNDMSCSLIPRTYSKRVCHPPIHAPTHPPYHLAIQSLIYLCTGKWTHWPYGDSYPDHRLIHAQRTTHFSPEAEVLSQQVHTMSAMFGHGLRYRKQSQNMIVISMKIHVHVYISQWWIVGRNIKGTRLY